MILSFGLTFLERLGNLDFSGKDMKEGGFLSLSYSFCLGNIIGTLREGGRGGERQERTAAREASAAAPEGPGGRRGGEGEGKGITPCSGEFSSSSPRYVYLSYMPSRQNFGSV